MRMPILKILSGVMILFSGCHSSDGIVSNRLRISTEKINFPINTKCPVNLRLKDGYFDTFISLFSFDQWPKYEEYDLIVTIAEFSIIMQREQWIFRKDGKDTFLGKPDQPMLILCGINRQKTPVLMVKPDWKSQESKLIRLSPEDYSLSANGVLEIPILFNVIKSNPELYCDCVEFIIHSNWYQNGRW